MPRKVSREERWKTGANLSHPKKRMPPQKCKKDDVQCSSASAKKIKLNTSLEVEEDFEKHYRIIDFILVFSTISTLAKCVKCDGKRSFSSCKKEGLGFNIKVTCEKCSQPWYVSSSERIASCTYDVNFRFIFAMRVLGLGLGGNCNTF